MTSRQAFAQNSSEKMATPVVSEAQVLQPKRPRNTIDDTTHHVEKRAKKAAARNGATSKQARKPKPTVPKTKKAVHDLLKSLGVENPTKVGCCLKAGIMNGYVKLLAPENDPEGEFGLDQV